MPMPTKSAPVSHVYGLDGEEIWEKTPVPVLLPYLFWEYLNQCNGSMRR